jgi:hypothetical protein
VDDDDMGSRGVMVSVTVVVVVVVFVFSPYVADEEVAMSFRPATPSRDLLSSSSTSTEAPP